MVRMALLTSLLFISSLAHAEEKKSFHNYISMKYGTVQTGWEGDLDARFKNDDGTLKEVEFFWGSYSYAKLIGGINLGGNNKFAGYSLGLVLNNDDIISAAQYITDDELLKSESGDGGNFGTGKTFGRRKATTSEFSWFFSRVNNAFNHITYGQSNYPARVTVSEEPTAEDDKTFIDPSPNIQYLYYGFEIDPIRAALLDEKEFQNLAADWWFFQAKMGFGAYYFELSDTQYSFVYQNVDNQYGLANESGLEPFMGISVDVGAVQTYDTAFARGIAALAYYAKFPPTAVFTKLYKLNETERGYYFSADGNPHHGLLGRIAVTF